MNGAPKLTRRLNLKGLKRSKRKGLKPPKRKPVVIVQLMVKVISSSNNLLDRDVSKALLFLSQKKSFLAHVVQVKLQ